MYRPTISPRDALAEAIRGLLKMLMIKHGYDDDTADLIGAIIGGAVKGIGIEKQTSIYSEIDYALKSAWVDILSKKEYETLPDDCKEELKKKVISTGNIVDIINANQPENILRSRIIDILKRYTKWNGIELNTLSRYMSDVLIKEINKTLDKDGILTLVAKTDALLKSQNITVDKIEKLDGIQDSIQELCAEFRRQIEIIQSIAHQTQEHAEDILINRLKNHCENTYIHSGNYLLNEIHKELFPDIADEQKNLIYRTQGDGDISLYEFLKKDNGDSTILLKGNGGTGKTISMIQSCNRLLEEGLLAVYIPLNQIRNCDGYDPVKDYIRKHILGYDTVSFGIFEHNANNDTDIKVYLFLDGVNEFPSQNLNRLYELINAKRYSAEWKGTRIILSSRSGLDDPGIKVLEMLPLGEDNILEFLERTHVNIPENRKVLELINNPLMLVLYADAEKYASLYNQQGTRFHIQLEEQPDSATKIIWNYLQTQLYKMASISNDNGDYILYHVLLDYVLPSVAFQMTTTKTLSEKEFRKLLKNILGDDNKLFLWYSENVLEDLWWDFHVEEEQITKKNIKDIHYFAIKKFRFLNLTYHPYDDNDKNVNFLHQEFRDYFAGLYVANEIKMMSSQRNIDATLPLLSLGIGKQKIDARILEYCGGSLKEELACPQKTCDGYIFPGKNGREPSAYSLAEITLNRLKHLTEEKNPGVSTVVANLMEILRLSRANLLAQCDFSNLDLRRSQMNGCYFSEFYNNELYTSVFDGSYISKTFLLNFGHGSSVCAVTEGLDGWIYSIDEDGYLLCWNYKNDESFTVKQYLGSPKALAYNKTKNILCIVMNDQISMIECNQYTEIYSRYNETGSKQFRYVKFDENDNAKYAYDLYPLDWFDLRTGEREFYSNDSFVTGCICECNKINKKVYSLFGRNICVRDYNNPSDSNDLNYKDIIRGVWTDIEIDAPQVLHGRINSISVNEDQTNFIISIDNHAIKYNLIDISDRNDLKPIWKYKCSKIIRDIRFLRDGGFVLAAGRDVLIIDEKGNTIKKLQHQPIGKIVTFISGCIDDDDETNIHHKEDIYYLVSGEGNIKELDRKLNVKRMRYVFSPTKFMWVKDKFTKEIQMLFGPSSIYPDGYRFSFLTGDIKPSGWCFEVKNTQENIYLRKYTLSKGTKVAVYDIRDKNAVFEYRNYTGINVYGCTFLDIKGSMSDPASLRLLKSNGGVVNGL